jgi:hypothetical protein
MNKIQKDLIYCNSISSQTLLGFNNCFGMTEMGKTKEIKIVNFYLESLEDLIENYKFDLPVAVTLLSERVGMIADWRIPDSFYNDYICEVCCPASLLPMSQQIHHVLEMGRGRRTETHCADGMVFISYKMGIEPYALDKK